MENLTIYDKKEKKIISNAKKASKERCTEMYLISTDGTITGFTQEQKIYLKNNETIKRLK